MSFRDKMDMTKQRFNQSGKQQNGALDSGEFNVKDNIKSEFDMWSWIFQEIANLRVEVSRLGTFVRVNNPNSPNYLEAYHSHIYSLLLPVSVVISDELWNKINKMWMSAKIDLDAYMTQRKAVPNKKIPNELIKKLDNLYRISLLAAQRSGLGFKVQVMHDIEDAIEKAIIISK